MSSDFLTAVWGDLDGREQLGEIRLLRGRAVERRYFPSPVRAWEFASQRSAEGWDAYFGVLPRIREGGTAEDVTDEVDVLWADVDAKKFSPVDEIGKFQALTAINALPFPAQFLVDSGGGYHAYWLLDQYVPYERARRAMVWIAGRVNGDHVQDKPRILRVPGTLNWKRETPRPARLLRFDLTRATRISDLEGAIPPEPEYRRRSGQPPIRVEKLPEWLVDLIADGAPQGLRSEACFKVILYLIRYGRTYEEILDLFQATPDGIGQKMAEKGSQGLSWFSYTYDAAEREA